MAGIPDASLLVQDLLSPPSTQLAPSTPALITYHLSTAPPALVTVVLQTISTSPSLWHGQASLGSDGWAVLNWTRAREVYDAIRNGVVYRAGEVTKELGTGWSARRRYGAFVEAYVTGVSAIDECHPTIRLLLANAVLAGLQVVKARKDKLYVGGSALMGRAQGEVLRAWEAFFTAVPDVGVGEWNGQGRDGDEMLPAWLASQTLPMFPVDALKSAPLPALLSLLSYAFSSTFSHGNLFASLSSDLSPTPAGLHWNIPSPSHTLISSLLASPLFTSLGPLSRAIGRLLEAAGSLASATSIAALRTTLDSTDRVASRIHREWASCPWSDAVSESAFDPETREHTEPWTTLKSLLFALTLVQSSLLVVIAPRPATELKVELARQALRTMGATYFVSSKFGAEGFGAWRGVWSGLVEIVPGDAEACEVLLRELQPPAIGRVHSREVERSVATFYMNAAEQLMKPLNTAYVEDPLLRCCRPYLEDPTHRDAFESAHSVLLAIFATDKECANELAPWYTQLLLKAYPTLMTPSQLRLAFTTMVRCLSNADDALAWYCIIQLLAVICAIVPSPPSPAPETAPPAAQDLSPLELRALSLPRGHLLLILIEQTTVVNLILLRTLLDRIWELLGEEVGGDGREALVDVLFKTIGEGLDAGKRGEGVRVWLERRGELGG